MFGTTKLGFGFEEFVNQRGNKIQGAKENERGNELKQLQNVHPLFGTTNTRFGFEGLLIRREVRFKRNRKIRGRSMRFKSNKKIRGAMTFKRHKKINDREMDLIRL